MGFSGANLPCTDEHEKRSEDVQPGFQPSANGVRIVLSISVVDNLFLSVVRSISYVKFSSHTPVVRSWVMLCDCRVCRHGDEK